MKYSFDMFRHFDGIKSLVSAIDPLEKLINKKKN